MPLDRRPDNRLVRSGLQRLLKRSHPRRPLPLCQPFFGRRQFGKRAPRPAGLIGQALKPEFGVTLPPCKRKVPRVPPEKQMAITNKLVFDLLLAAVAAAAVCAQEPTPIALSTSNCVVRFEVASTWSLIKGEVKQVGGSLRFGRPGDAVSLQGTVEINVNDLTTGDAGRDAKMQRSCLESAKYPRITFVLERCAAFEGNMLTLEGQMTIRNVTRRLVLGAQYTVDDTHCMLSGGGGLKWPDYGVRSPSTFFSEVQPSVKLTFELKLPRNP
jgi:polyisoprenoid-binding protein YceI